MSTDLVPRTRTIVGKADHVANLIEQRDQRGELVREVSWTVLSRSRVRAELVLLEPARQPRVVIDGRLLPRLRQRVWPSNRPWYVYVGRLIAAGVVAMAAAGVGYLTYTAVESVITTVQFIHRYWKVFRVLGVLALALFVVGAVKGGGKAVELVSRFCHACGRALG